MSNQPVLRLNQSGLSAKLHTKQELYPEPLCAASLGDDTNQLLDSCDFEEFAFNDVSELLDNDWTDPHTPLDSLLADSLPGIDDTSTYDSSQAGSWPASSSVATTFSAIGKDSVTSRNSELQEASTQLRLSRPSLRTVSTASHSPVPDTAAATFLSLYEETRAAYLKELRRLREFLLNSYKSAGKAPNADGQTKLSELEGLISFFQPRRHELEAYHQTPDGLQRLRHLRDVARAYVQFYRSMKPKRDQARRPPAPAPLSLRSQPAPPLHPHPHPPASPSPLPSTPGPNPFSQNPPRSLRVLTPSKRERSSSPPWQPFPTFSHPHPHHLNPYAPHPDDSRSHSRSHSHSHSHSLETDSNRSSSLSVAARLHTPHPVSPQMSNSDMSAFARDSPTVSTLSDNLATSSLRLPLGQMSLQPCCGLLLLACWAPLRLEQQQPATASCSLAASTGLAAS